MTDRMATLTIKLADEQQARLRQLAKQKGLSVDQFMQELSTIAVAEFDAETRFRTLASRGKRAKGLKVLDKLDHAFGRK